jgi:hypothetical protein
VKMNCRFSSVLLVIALAACERIPPQAPSAAQNARIGNGSAGASQATTVAGSSGANSAGASESEAVQPLAGAPCSDASECASNSCGRNGICCAGPSAIGADCCGTVMDCPSSYGWAPRCDDLATCQGTRAEATCENGVCGTISTEDDSACEGGTDCGMYAAMECKAGMIDQATRGCQTSCKLDSDCVMDAFCASGGCVARLADGERCDRDTQCKTRCGSNKICCNGEECCVTAADCPPDPGTCTQSCAGGRRRLRGCMEHVCVTQAGTIDDDSACAGMKFECGGYVYPDSCSSDERQDPCPVHCSGACDPGFSCVVVTPEQSRCLPLVPRSDGASGSSGSGGSGGASGVGGSDGT